ncbi:MAG TPA: CocE/NonD family hydrolase [Candidatus Eisenbacteria bacterium]|nr:CocE/NonD family hydrolase [Candidatus Eisenbacteria bacterium]
MRDAVVLKADIYRPRTDGKYPVLLQRTPYNKSGARAFGMRAAARGYLVVVQDVRGRYTSEGEWYPFRHEAQDGYDTVEWAAALPQSNGKVGMFGGSYVGATQFLAAIASPPHLAGIAPHVTASNYHENWTYQGGAFEQWFDQSWTSQLAQNTLTRTVVEDSNPLVWKNTLPLKDYPVLEVPDLRGLAPYYQDWLAHPNYDDYWKALSIEESYSHIQVPVLNIGAWYDIFLGGTLRNYTLLKTRAGSDAARNGQRLLVEIGGHSGWSTARKIGDVDFGPDAPHDLDDIVINWYDYLFKGVQNTFAGPKRVRLFVMGKNQWRDEDDWPLARARSTKYFLHSSGRANGSTGDGLLSTDLPASEPKDSFRYDPANPVPTIGGPLCCDSKHLAPGPRDQRPAEERTDVLVYTTPAFTKETEVTGPITLDLFAATSAKDTDFTGKLVDVWPDGFAQNLTEGILRLRYRDSREKPDFANPGEIYHLALDLWATSNVFLPGHRLRLEVSSSNFPRFARNLNSGEDSATGSKMKVATNTIYHDSEHPSALVLPIVP